MPRQKIDRHRAEGEIFPPRDFLTFLFIGLGDYRASSERNPSFLPYARTARNPLSEVRQKRGKVCFSTPKQTLVSQLSAN